MDGLEIIDNIEECDIIEYGFESFEKGEKLSEDEVEDFKQVYFQ